jgi:hypothetical protein
MVKVYAPAPAKYIKKACRERDNPGITSLPALMFRRIAMKLRIFVVINLFLVALIIGGCTTGFSPRTAFGEFTKAMREGKWDTVWEMLSSKTQKSFEDEGYKKMKEIIEAMPSDMKKEKVAELGVTHTQLLKMNPREFFVLVMQKTNASKEFFKDSANDEVEKVQIKNGKAKLKIKGKNEVATMVMEKGNWKVEFEDD